jgi:N-methylhydantoinase A
VQIAIDTGGTFTDCVYLEDNEIRVLKVLSTPEDPGMALLEAVRTIAGNTASQVRHGTTVATNTVLERTGAKIAFVTTAGFEDTIAVGRQARSDLYNWLVAAPPVLVPAELRFGVRERTSSEGKILFDPSEDELAMLRENIRRSGAQSIAVSLLFSFANPTNESKVIEALAPLGLPISVSHVILPEFREYERAATICMNAYLAPRTGAYLRSVAAGLGSASQFDVMQSSGGIIDAEFASEQPVRTVLSGPAGGVIGAYHVARLAGFDKIITFDMGGTSTDVALIDSSEGGPRVTNEMQIGNIPISVPMLDIHTVGAGGGSIARFDDAGLLHVGPESAGAIPGPICYGRGTKPTVSDANLVLGRLQADQFLDGKMKLDEQRTRELMDAARHDLSSVEIFASGIVSLAETTIGQAIRLISVERGYDPREFTLIAFGGAGPLHACSIAKSLGIRRVLIPALPGALSAVGILLADTVRDYSKTVMVSPNDDLDGHFNELEQGAAEDLGSSGVRDRSLDVRYRGQGYELNVPAGPDAVRQFHRAHRRRYGHSDEKKTVEVVNVRLRVTVEYARVPFRKSSPAIEDAGRPMPRTRPVTFDGQSIETRVYGRQGLRSGNRISGPAIVVEYSATTVLPPGCVLTVDAYQNLIIEVGE